MHPIYGCPENFRDSLTTPHGYYSQYFSWAFVPIDPMNVPKKFKSVALPVPEIIGVPKKFGRVKYTYGTPTKFPELFHLQQASPELPLRQLDGSRVFYGYYFICQPLITAY